MKSLGQILTAAVGGALPAADGLVVVVAAPKGARAAIVAFTGHHVVAAAVDPEWVARLCPARALEAPFGPAFVTALGERLGAEPGTLDVVLVAAGAPVGGAPDAAADPHADLVLRPATAAEHREALADAPNPVWTHGCGSRRTASVASCWVAAWKAAGRPPSAWPRPPEDRVWADGWPPQPAV